MLTTKHNLLSSLQNNDWLMLGFDLSMLAFAGCFAFAAVVLQKRSDFSNSNPHTE